MLPRHNAALGSHKASLSTMRARRSCLNVLLIWGRLMRQNVLRVVCDSCGLIVSFEVMNSDPLTYTMYPQTMLDRQGWRSRPKEGSTGVFSPTDLCPECVKGGT